MIIDDISFLTRFLASYIFDENIYVSFVSKVTLFSKLMLFSKICTMTLYLYTV